MGKINKFFFWIFELQKHTGMDSSKYEMLITLESVQIIKNLAYDAVRLWRINMLQTNSSVW